jgi:hypothetical protein
MGVPVELNDPPSTFANDRSRKFQPTLRLQKKSTLRLAGGFLPH